jgi:hypothetical protein
MPEMGALCTYGQWTGLFYIRTDSFIFVISSYTDMELMLYGHSSLFSPFILLMDTRVYCWATSPDILSFHFISLLLTSDYNNLGVWIEGESPDGAPHMIICE